MAYYFSNFLLYSEVPQILANLGPGMDELCRLILLISNGTLILSVYFRVLKVVAAVALIGALFRILHWPEGVVLLPAALLGVLITYGLHFMGKPAKMCLAFLKLPWVLAFVFTASTLLGHWLPCEAAYLPHVLLWLAVLDFVYADMKPKSTAATKWHR